VRFCHRVFVMNRAQCALWRARSMIVEYGMIERAIRSLLLQPRYEGHSALGCCTGLPWRSMLTPTRTAGTAQTTQLAL
jgi:hypothetical protein